jgi:RNA polymerase sigma-70 factor (ECF subfamily)
MANTGKKPATPPANEGKFVSLYAQYQNDLFRYVAALIPNLHDAEDVVGEITVALWERFSEFEHGTAFLAWARQIAYFRVLKYYRARDRRLTLPQQLLEKLTSDIASRQETVDQRLSYLTECKEQLSAQDSQLLDERYVKRQKVQDLARRLTQSENSVSKSLGRIRRTLLSCIEQKMASEKQATQTDSLNFGD